MYDELVKLARYCAEKDACINCPVGECQGTTGIMNHLADAIEELSKPRWIPVTERLPEPYVNVLAFDGENVGIAYYQKKSQYWLPDWMFDDACVDVTHWMSLPEPPKEEA